MPVDQSPSPPRRVATARIVKAGPLHQLSGDPANQYHQALLDLIARNLEPPAHPCRALDLECATGIWTRALFEHLPVDSTVVALNDDRVSLKIFHDQLPRSLRRAIYPRKERRHYLPFADHVFDRVWAILPGKPMDPLRGVLREAFRVLHPNGRLILATPLQDTFVELARVLASSFENQSDPETISHLFAHPPQLLTPTEWTETISRSGGLASQIQTHTLPLTLRPPLSAQPLFAQELYPVWIDPEHPQHTPLLHQLDQLILEPLSVTLHLGAVLAQPGPEPLGDDPTFADPPSSDQP